MTEKDFLNFIDFIVQNQIISSEKWNDIFKKVIPRKMFNTNFCINLIKIDKFFLNYIPNKYLSSALLKIALKQDGNDLFIIPYNKRSQKLCRIAVKNNPYALMYVPHFEGKIYETIAMLAIRNKGISLKWVKSDRITLKMCKAALNENLSAWPSVPQKFRDILKREYHIND